MEDTFNEDGVKKIAIEHRGCRFPNEKRTYNLFDIYSRDSCYVEVRQFFSFITNISNIIIIIHYRSTEELHIIYDPTLIVKNECYL